MKLSSKLSFLVLGIIIPVIFLFYIINAGLVLNEAVKYENKLGQKQGLRLKEQINKQFDMVRSSSKDWGGWDETYFYIQGKNPNYIKNNLADPLVALGALRSDFILLINKNGEIFYSSAGDFQNNVEIPVPDYIKSEFSVLAKNYFSQQNRREVNREGFIVKPEGAILFSSNPIVRSTFKGEPQGLIFLGRFLDDRLLQSFRDVLQGDIELVNMASETQKSKHLTVLKNLEQGKVHLEIRDDNLDVYLLINDFKGEPNVLAYATLERYMHGMFVHILKTEGLLWFLVAVLLVILFFLGNRFFVVKRIKYFAEIFEKVKNKDDLTTRANEKWDDEFESLATGFNHMMLALAEKQQQLVHSSKMASIGILTSGVAHEINNPLFIAKGYVQILIRKIKKDENLKPYEESLLQADMALTRIEEIVRTLQQYSKGSEVGKEMIRLNHVIEDALLVSKSRMTKSNIVVKTDIAQEDWEIEGSFSSAQQIVINLLVNAVEALELVPQDQRFLNIMLTRSGDKIVLSVMDSGPGIKPEIIHKIYDAFFTTKEVGKGIGLGLFTVHSFVQILGAEIKCESELGRGASFKIIFPAAHK